jgi:DNA-binding transcriptional LysR family regulator
VDTDYLRTFIEIIKRGSFSEAASALGITQPAVSLQVRRLEDDLNVRLLERGGGKIRLTSAGERFLRHCRDVVAHEQKLIEGLSQLSDEVRGSLSIAASTVPGEFLVPALLAEFVALNPAIDATVTIGDTDAVIDRAINGECDIGFTGARARHGRLHHLPFVRDRVILVAAMNHPFSQRSKVSIGELDGQPLVTREHGSGTMANVRRQLQDAGVKHDVWSSTTVLGSTEAVISGVQAGLGVAFVSAFAAATPVRAQTLAAVTVEGVDLERDLFIVYPQGGLATRSEREFVEFAHSWGARHQPPVLGAR